MADKAVKGLERLLKALDKSPKELEAVIEAELEDAARNVELVAKRRAPVDTGKLRQLINASKEGKLQWRVSALAPYSAYMEFGTGGLVDVPPELEDIAIQFKGKGVRQVNIRPRPFLYPALVQQRGEFAENIEKEVEIYLKKI